MPEGQNTQPSAYRSWKSANAASNFGWITTAVYVAFMGFFLGAQDEASEIIGISSPAVWKTLLVVAGLSFAGGVSMSVASVTAKKHLGVSYGEDRVRFARLGGFDVGRIPMLLVQLALFGLYWLTLNTGSDMIGPLRRPWVYLLTSTLIGLLITKVVAVHHFARVAASPGWRARSSTFPPWGIRLIALTSERLELRHGTMFLRLLAAAGCFGLAVAAYLRLGLNDEFVPREVARWGGFGLATALGLAMLLIASSRHIAFDKRAGRVEVRDRHIWGRTSIESLPLHDVSSITAIQETAAGSQLTNIFVNTPRSRFPLIMGARRAASARQHAILIGWFLGVPVYEDETLLAVSPDLSVDDILELIHSTRRSEERQAKRSAADERAMTEATASTARIDQVRRRHPAAFKDLQDSLNRGDTARVEKLMRELHLLDE